MEQKIIFREMLSEVLKLADARGNHLTTAEIDEFFANTHLTRAQMELVYEYLMEQKVQVEGYESRKQETLASAVEKKMAGTPEAEARQEELSDAGTARDQENEEVGALELYLKELETIDHPEPAQELELFTLAAGGDGAAKSRLVELYLPLVCQLAGDYQGQDVLAEDLIQEGNVGLLLAVDRIERQENLAAYQAKLMNAVNQYMQDVIQEQKDLKDLGEGVVRKVNHLNEAIHNLEEDLEHRVSVEELSAYLDMPVEEIRDILRMAGDEIKVEGYEN